MGPGGRADRGRRSRRAATPASQRPVDRPTPEDELRPRAAQRPLDPVPRRADARSRRRGRTPGPRARDRLAGVGPGADGPPDHALHGRSGRAVRADRHRRSRPGPGDRQPGRAQAAGPARVDLPDRARPARRRHERPRPRPGRRQRDRRGHERSDARRPPEGRGQPRPRRRRSARWGRRRAGRDGLADPRPAQVGADPRGGLRRAGRARVRRRRDRTTRGRGDGAAAVGAGRGRSHEAGVPGPEDLE